MLTGAPVTRVHRDGRRVTGIGYGGREPGAVEADHYISTIAITVLARLVRPHVRAAELRRAMADALQDPQLVVVYWAGANPGRWVDESGWPVEPGV